jgi:hypothetical protein
MDVLHKEEKSMLDEEGMKLRSPNPVFEQTFSKRGLGVRICLGYYLHES